MHANIVTIQYKSSADADASVKKLESEILPQVRRVDGFRGLTLIRTGPTTTLHTGIFADAHGAERARTDLAPVVRDALTDHMTEPPRIEHGDVQISA